MPDMPNGELTVRLVARPMDTNPAGDVFGGWILSQMDIAGGVFCRKIAKGRVVTIAIDKTTFKNPVFIGDTVSVYVNLLKQGRTSMTVHIETWVNRMYEAETHILVTRGDFVYVSIDENRNSRPIPDSE